MCPPESRLRRELWKDLSRAIIVEHLAVEQMIEIGGKATGTKGGTREGMKDDTTTEIQGTTDGREGGTSTGLETDLQLAFMIATDIGIGTASGVTIEIGRIVMGDVERKDTLIGKVGSIELDCNIRNLKVATIQ